MERYVTYQEVCEEIKKVFASKGFKGNKMNFSYDMKEYLLVASFYKSRWGGTLYGDMGIYFYELHPQGLEHRQANWADSMERIFETNYDANIDLERMRLALLWALSIFDKIIGEGIWNILKTQKYEFLNRPRTIDFIYHKIGVKVQ